MHTVGLITFDISSPINSAVVPTQWECAHEAWRLFASNLRDFTTYLFPPPFVNCPWGRSSRWCVFSRAYQLANVRYLLAKGVSCRTTGSLSGVRLHRICDSWFEQGTAFCTHVGLTAFGTRLMYIWNWPYLILSRLGHWLAQVIPVLRCTLPSTCHIERGYSSEQVLKSDTHSILFESLRHVETFLIEDNFACTGLAHLWYLMFVSCYFIAGCEGEYDTRYNTNI